MKRRGKLIVIEGVDAAGKATQTKLLINKLKEMGFPVKTYTFPDYETETGKVIRQFLNGDFGDPTTISPYLSGNLYATDRAKYAEQINKELNQGITVVVDRYSTSNIGFQACKLDDNSDFKRYIDDNFYLEHKANKLPEPDVVLFLDVSPDFSMELSKERGNQDLNESNLKYLNKAYSAYITAMSINAYGNWEAIECITESGLRKPEDISDDIYSRLTDVGIITAQDPKEGQQDYSPDLDDSSMMFITKDHPPVMRYVVCAAAKVTTLDDEEIIICSARHMDKVMNRQLDSYLRNKTEQGFIDQYGNFLTRKEAMQVVKDNDQRFDLYRNGNVDTWLSSEGLY